MPLTEAQSLFINSKADFIRLLAPAGCGKTFSVVEKAKKLVDENPKIKINIFTFTKNATEEIKERCGNKITNVSVHTLNSWGNGYIAKNVLKHAQIIKNEHKKWYVLNALQPIWSSPKHSARFEVVLLGKRGQKKVQNSEKILALIDQFKNIGFKHIDFTRKFEENLEKYKQHLQFIKKVSLHRYYSTIVNEVILMIGKKKEADLPEQKKHEIIVRHWIPFWCDCCEHMLKTGLYTFDDQKYFANIELEKKLTTGKKRSGASKVDYIFIDEFQDTSPLDLSLIANLQKINNAALVIVGDDDQAIYEFRGASPYFILHPEQMFGHKFKTFILDENFRSPQNVVNKSVKLIRHNENRVDKDVKSTSKTKNASIKLIELETQEKMIDAIIQDIKQTAEDPTKTIAVLSRLKSSLLPYQILLTKENIPYSVSDDLAFFYTAGAKNLDRAMAIKQGHNTTPEALTDLVCMFSKNEIYQEPRGILTRAFYANYATLDNLAKIMLLLGEKQDKFKALFTHDWIVECVASIEKFYKANTVFDTLSILLTEFGGFQANYNRSLEDLYYRDPPFASLLNFAEKYNDNFSAFVQDFDRAMAKASSKNEDQDLLLPENENKNIILSTALRVKGQEFDKVIIIDANNGIWPKQVKNIAEAEREDIESERRLFYVATTRPKQFLHIYRSTTMNTYETQISPFVKEGSYN